MLQSALPGYRERIVHVHLKDSEGGLNLNMSQETIDLLVELGDRAGTLLSGDKTDKNDMAPFKMDDHRWRRFLVAFARLEETLCSAARRWNRASPQESFADFVRRTIPSPPSYGNSTLSLARGRFRAFRRLDAACSVLVR